MPRRRNSRGQYMRDRAERKMMMRRDERRRDRDYDYGMDYGYGYPEYNTRGDYTMGRDRRYDERHNMGYEQPYESRRVYDYGYDMRGDYRRDMDYDYRNDRDYDYDYADKENDKQYHEDLKKWSEKLKRYDRFGIPKEQIIQNAKQMGVEFKDFDEEEFYTIYLMHISDYPSIANDSRMYLSMAKSWLEDKDLKIDPSEKVCKYLYEIVMADED